jgi:hypothetical protein
MLDYSSEGSINNTNYCITFNILRIPRTQLSILYQNESEKDGEGN